MPRRTVRREGVRRKLPPAQRPAAVRARGDKGSLQGFGRGEEELAGRGRLARGFGGHAQQNRKGARGASVQLPHQCRLQSDDAVQARRPLRARRVRRRLGLRHADRERQLRHADGQGGLDDIDARRQGAARAVRRRADRRDGSAQQAFRAAHHCVHLAVRLGGGRLRVRVAPDRDSRRRTCSDELSRLARLRRRDERAHLASHRRERGRPQGPPEHVLRHALPRRGGYDRAQRDGRHVERMVRPDPRGGLGAARPQLRHAVRAALRRLRQLQERPRVLDARADRRAVPRRRRAQQRQPEQRRAPRAVPDRPQQGREDVHRARREDGRGGEQAAPARGVAHSRALRHPRRRGVLGREEPDDMPDVRGHRIRLRLAELVRVLLPEPAADAAGRGARAPAGPHIRRRAQHDDVSVLQPTPLELHEGRDGGRGRVREQLHDHRLRRRDIAGAGGEAVSPGARRRVRTLPQHAQELLPPRAQPVLRLVRDDDRDAYRRLHRERRLLRRGEVRRGCRKPRADRARHDGPHGAQGVARGRRDRGIGILRRGRGAGVRLRRVGDARRIRRVLQLGGGELASSDERHPRERGVRGQGGEPHKPLDGERARVPPVGAQGDPAETRRARLGEESARILRQRDPVRHGAHRDGRRDGHRDPPLRAVPRPHREGARQREEGARPCAPVRLAPRADHAEGGRGHRFAGGDGGGVHQEPRRDLRHAALGRHWPWRNVRAGLRRT